MHRWRVFFSRAWGFLHKRRLDEDLREELQAHLDALTDANIRNGMTPEDARAAALREFGGVEQTKEIYRQQRGLPFLDVAVQDLRFALRGLVRRPGFAIASVLTLMLGIGATTAVFSVVDRILFRSLPYPHDDRLVSFGLLAPIERDEFTLGAGYIDFRKQPGPFEAITAMVPGATDCDVTEQNPVRLNCAGGTNFSAYVWHGADTRAKFYSGRRPQGCSSGSHSVVWIMEKPFRRKPRCFA
jgi:hypothetical protein